MKSPGIINGVILAFFISLAAGIASLLFGGFVADATLFSLILCASTLAYLVYLLKYSTARVGRIVVISGWAVASIASWLFDLPLFEQVFIQAGIVWLVRSLYFHTSIFAALLDFGLVSVGLAASAWAIVNTGSPATAIWSFFLTQSLFGWIPDLAKTKSGGAYGTHPGQPPFQTAHRVAVDAVRKLTQP
jgi:hypothetical protein